MNSDSFTVCIKTECIYVDIAKGIEIRFDISNYRLERPFIAQRKKIKSYWINENELAGKIMTEFPALRLKTYTIYLFNR